MILVRSPMLFKKIIEFKQHSGYTCRLLLVYIFESCHFCCFGILNSLSANKEAMPDICL